jgi:hypothetical protein
VSEGARNREALGLVVPFLLWGLGFVLLYAGHGLACALGVRPGFHDDTARSILTGLFLVVLAAQAWLAWLSWRRWRRRDIASLAFVRLISTILAVAALFATVWTGFPVLTLRICG